MTRSISRKTNGTNLLGFAKLVAILLDGPLTAPGAAEMLGVQPDTVEAQLRALEAAGVARIDRWRRNPHGKPTAIWEVSTCGDWSEPPPEPLCRRPKSNIAQRMST